MEVIQFIAVLFSVFALSRVFIRFKSKEISINEFIFWIFIWITIIITSVNPIIFDFISKIVQTKKPIDIVVYISIIVIFYLIFRVYVKLEKVESNITKIVREAALRQKEK